MDVSLAVVFLAAAVNVPLNSAAEEFVCPVRITDQRSIVVRHFLLQHAAVALELLVKQNLNDFCRGFLSHPTDH